MHEYLAERYEPGVTREQVEADASRLAAAAAKLQAKGHVIEFLGSTFVQGDEACFSRFVSSSAELVAAAHRLASVPMERVVEALSVRWQAGNEASGVGYGNVER